MATATENAIPHDASRTSDLPQAEWSGGPDQMQNLGTFLGMAGLAILFVVVCARVGVPAWAYLVAVAPWAAVAGWAALVTRCTRYAIDRDRLRVRHGVLNQVVDDLQLYRVKDFQIQRPLVLRVFGLGKVVLGTSDRTDPVLVLHALARVEQVANILSRCVEECRERKGTREVDIE